MVSTSSQHCCRVFNVSVLWTAENIQIMKDTPQKNDAVLDPRIVLRGLFVIRLCQSVLARIPDPKIISMHNFKGFIQSSILLMTRLEATSRLLLPSLSQDSPILYLKEVRLNTTTHNTQLHY